MGDTKEDDINYVYSYSPARIPLVVWVTVIFFMMILIILALYSLALKT